MKPVRRRTIRDMVCLVLRERMSEGSSGMPFSESGTEEATDQAIEKG